MPFSRNSFALTRLAGWSAAADFMLEVMDNFYISLAKQCSIREHFCSFEIHLTGTVELSAESDKGAPRAM